MADNVAITAGAGTTIRTDDVGGGVQVQVVKLAASADGSSMDLSRAEDAAHTSGDHGLMALGVRNDSSVALSGTDGDYTPIAVESSGAVHIHDGGGAITVDGTVTAELATGGSVSVNQTTANNYIAVRATDGSNFIDPGTEYTEDGVIPANAGKGILMVARRDNALSTLTPAEDDAVGLRVDTNGALWTILSGGTVGSVAHDAVVSGNPVLAGAEARATLGTAVATGDAVRVAATRYGILLSTALAPSRVSSNGTPITGTTTNVISAPGASTHTRVVRIHFSNGGSTSTWVSVRDGLSGSTYYATYLPQGGTVSLNLNASGPLDLTTNTRLDIVLSASGSVEYTIDYFTVAD